MEAEDIQRLKSSSKSTVVRDKQSLISDKIVKICEELERIRNVVIHSHECNDTAEHRLDQLINRLERIERTV